MLKNLSKVNKWSVGKRQMLKVSVDNEYKSCLENNAQYPSGRIINRLMKEDIGILPITVDDLEVLSKAL